MSAGFGCGVGNSGGFGRGEQNVGSFGRGHEENVGGVACRQWRKNIGGFGTPSTEKSYQMRQVGSLISC